MKQAEMTKADGGHKALCPPSTYTPAIELLALGVTLRTHETQKSVATLGSTSVITLMGALYNGLL